MKIPVTNLLVNPKNPRFDPVDSQQEAIETMVRDQNDKLLNLAKDIASYGLNPADLPIVISSDNVKGRYVVLEGNRRVVTLKLLLQPTLVENNQPFYKKISKIAATIDKAAIEEIDCCYYQDVGEAYHWIELKHTGENSGIGTVRWDSQQSDRFKGIQTGKKSPARQVLDYMQDSGGLDDVQKEKLRNLAITNLARLISDPYVRKSIGLDFVNGSLVTNLKDAELHKTLRRIISDLIDKKINVNDIRDSGDREDYIDTVVAECKPNMENVIDEPVAIDKEEEPEEKPEKPPKKKILPSSLERKRIIPSTCIITIHDDRVNEVYKELRGLEVDKFPNAGGVLFRVFLEMSVDRYIAKYSLPGVNENSALRRKVKAVKDDIAGKGLMTSQELQPVDKAVFSDNSIFSINTFNAYVHNPNFYPNSKDIKIAWNNLGRFIEKIWEEQSPAEE